MGGNLFFAGTGAVLDTVGVEIDDALLAGWRTRVERARRHLGWDPTAPGSPTAPTIVARPHATGVSLALQAPLDQLFTATELNEWALCATLFERDPVRWANLTEDLLADYLADARQPSDVIPPVLEESAALARLARRAASERRPDVVALIAEAATRGVCHMLDETALTLGAGVGCRSWPLDALPRPGDVPWNTVRTIPIAAVTGSNGKTTTVRLVAACARAHGWRDGFNCTDGVFIERAVVATGDYSGPAGTRRVLRDATVEAAVLETARGGILRRGLAIDRADVAIVTNISPDHFGEYGIDDLDGLADVKLTIAHLLRRRRPADPECRRRLAVCAKSRCSSSGLAGSRRSAGSRATTIIPHWSSIALPAAPPAAYVLDACSPRLTAASTTWVRSTACRSRSMARRRTTSRTWRARRWSRRSSVFRRPTIAQVFATFGRDLADNAGRLMRFDIGGVKIVVDYAHNPDGLRGVMRVAERLRAPAGRIGMLLGHAGNRLNADIEDLAFVATEFGPDLIVVKEDEGHLRGRQPGEVPAIIRARCSGRHAGVSRADLSVGSRCGTDGTGLGAARRRAGAPHPLQSARVRMLEILESRRDA